jgi:hypothetical protein
MTNYTRVQIRRGTAANWIADNPILANGEQALEIDTLNTKFGDGVTNYVDLPYQDQIGPTGPRGATGPIGPTGPKGETGSFGGAIFNYGYLTDTTDSDPGSGKLKFDNSLTTATQLFIDFEDTSATDNQNYLNAIDDSTSSIKGHFKIEVVGSPEDYVYYAITGEHYHHASYFEVPVQYLSGSVTTIPNDTPVTITFVRTGDKGDQGPTGPTGISTLIKGSFPTTQDLPLSGISIGDGFIIEADGCLYVWTITGYANVGIVVGPTGPTGPIGPTGPNVINWQGAWNSNTQYASSSVVRYDGQAYISVGTSYATENPSSNPTNISTWQLFVAKGNDGTIGVDGATGAAAPTITEIVTIPDSSYTLLLTDNNKLLYFTNSSAVTLIIPTNASVALPIGSTINFTQAGSGQVFATGPSGGTLNYTPGTKTRAQWSVASAIKTGTNTWLLGGDLVS